MPLEAPILDSRRFEQIFEQARLRIQRYAPEWTDFNESDPGITLLQLFAWLTEMMLFEMNRLPELNYIKFLKLLNMELRPAQPATAYLTLSVTPKAPQVDPVRARTQFAAQNPEGGDLLIFEAEQGTGLVKAKLKSVQVFDGSVFSLLTAANETPGTCFRPLGWQPQPNSALYLGFDTAVTGKPFPQQIRLRVFLPGAALAGVAQNSREVRQPPRPPVSIEWEYRQTETRWRRMNVFEDGSSAFTREGDIVLEGPTTEIVPTIEGREPTQLYWLRARLVSGNYPAGREPEIDFIRPNTIKVVNLATVREEVVGTSDGEPRQAFRVRNIPAAFNSLTLAVSAENDTLETWTRVDDFFASGPDDPHYTLNHSSGEIVFGNGSRGRIPPAAAQIVAREYRYGGGKSGNVGAQLITVPMTALAGVEKVANERPAVGGRDEQPLEELLEEAPRTLRHRNRSVTADDFAALAQDAGGVARATAIGLAHPGHPGVEVPGAVTVVVVPDNDDVPPQPSSDLIRSVCRYLDGFRLLTTELFVKGPEYRRIRVDAAVEAQAYASFDAVAQDIVTAINRYLAPLGGRQADGSRAPGWPFGQDLRPTNLFNVILDVKNVVGVKTLQIYVDGQPHALQDPVRLPPDGLLYGSDHVITVGPAEDL